MVTGKQFPGAPQAGLNFIRDEKHIVLLANVCNLL